MRHEDILRNYYREKIEGGGHPNLRGAVLEYLVKNELRAKHYLDIGCANGSFSIQIAKEVGAEKTFGIDISPSALKEAEKNGVRVYMIDINKDSLPFDSGSIDLITSFEVIEHLLSTDNLISESYRVIKEGGYFIISTPNLASWINRIYLVLGRQPRSYEVSLNVKLDGVLKGGYEPIGHIRLYTLKSLKDHLTHYEFKIIKVLGCPEPIGIHEHDPRITIRLAGYIHNLVDAVLGRLPSLSNSFAIIAKK